MYNILCIDAFCCSMFFVSNLQCSLFIYQYISVFVCVVYIYIYTPYVIPRFQSFTENHLVFWWRVKFDQLHVGHALRSVLTQAKHDSCGLQYYFLGSLSEPTDTEVTSLGSPKYLCLQQITTLLGTHYDTLWALKLCLQSSRSGCQKLFLIQFYPAPGPAQTDPQQITAMSES